MSGEGARPRTACIVTHHEYGAYVGEAVDSVVTQTVPFDEVVVVEDGSTDGSRAVVREVCARHPGVALVEQDNRGQLGAFHAGLEATRGDLVVFLDADDRLEPGHLARTLAWFDAHPGCGWAVSAWRTFGDEEGLHRDHDADTTLGFHVVLALAGSLKKLGVSPTSTMVFRRAVLERFLPIPFEDEWRTRADDCLILGASLAGAEKAYLTEPLVAYRVHGDNAFHGREFSRADGYRRSVALRRLVPWLCERLGYGGPPVELATKEFRQLGRPRAKDLRAYWKVVWRSRMPLGAKLGASWGLARHFVAPR